MHLTIAQKKALQAVSDGKVKGMEPFAKPHGRSEYCGNELSYLTQQGLVRLKGGKGSFLREKYALTDAGRLALEKQCK